MSLLALDAPLLELLTGTRRAVLATVRPNGAPRLVPITYAVDLSADVLYSALDEKPKSVADPRRLARVSDIAARSQVCVLVDRWSEDWSQLAWLRVDGYARLLEPAEPTAAAEHAAAVARLRQRYAQYATHRLERAPLLRIAVERVRGWTA